jgi:hypothetical protein
MVTESCTASSARTGAPPNMANAAPSSKAGNSRADAVSVAFGAVGKARLLHREIDA